VSVIDDGHDNRADHATPDVADAAEHHHQQQVTISVIV
jgi:hypothetical protein